jgi:hypothetical protein
MNTGARYILANCRLAAMADVSRLTDDELLDIAALAPAPTTSMDEWMRRRDIIRPQEEPAAAQAPQEEVEDPVTTASVQAILNGEANELIKLGILEVREVKSA